MATISLVLLSCCGYSYNTKEEVDYAISSFRANFIDRLGSDFSKNCYQNPGIKIINDFDADHQSFMTGDFRESILMSLNHAEKYSYFPQNTTCPTYLLQQRNIALTYAIFYAQTLPLDAQPHSGPTLSAEKPTLNEIQKVSQLTTYFQRTLMDACLKTHNCTQKHQEILNKLNQLQDTVHDSKTDSRDILQLTIALNSMLIQSIHNGPSVDITNALINIQTRLSFILNLMKPHAFSNKTLTLLEEYQLKALNYILNEKSPHATCPVLLSQYYTTINENIFMGASTNFLSLTNAQGHVLEALAFYNHSSNVYFRNADCNTRENELILFAHDFSSAVRGQIKNLLYADKL